MKETDRQELEQHVRRARRLIDEGKLNDPSTVRAVQSLEERLKFGLFDQRTEAEAGRLFLLLRDFRRRIEQ